MSQALHSAAWPAFLFNPWCASTLTCVRKASTGSAAFIGPGTKCGSLVGNPSPGNLSSSEVGGHYVLTCRWNSASSLTKYCMRSLRMSDAGSDGDADVAADESSSRDRALS